jgi:hypothetical protein
VDGASDVPSNAGMERMATTGRIGRRTVWSMRVAVWSMRVAVWAALLCSLWGGLAMPVRPALANIFVVDDRVAVERVPGTPWAAVGLITQPAGDDGIPGGGAGEAAGFRFGTVTLVGPCHALTAHHTAFDAPDAARPEVASDLWFGPPRGDGFPWTWRVSARPVAWGDLGGHVNADWALLELETCLGRALGWWALAPLAHAQAAALGPRGLMAIGHPAAAARETALLDPGCGVYGESGRVPGWDTDCAVRVGNSGGPLFVGFDPADPPVRPRLVAIVKGDFFPQGEGVVIPQWDARAANRALPVAAFAEALAPHLDAGLARAARELERP